ncbi:TetR/AcrR family transcriptional regulator [Ancylobacter defluvii]|uniref:TetR family transcriptional regulator n=1 Tax=Ancylobacter defluvii TaxID=1282440 RepID=A0A9W6JW71_9HYPH|nr:TetR/AcrR family transcriptional regulator [Ancylobacter defluvii]MBS7589318.1 TetR/AcrR family transcriptional regulator [Ancylobacter defluvii]GLK84931.1 TetR family transcriptional regulator [Ancylobacter defluvii]
MPDAAARSTARRSSSRRTGRGQATCERLRRVAACLFVSRGYDGVSLDEIVQAAGGSKTNIYAFYGGKEGLFVAAIEEALSEVLRPLTEADTQGQGLEAGLTRLGRALIDALLSPPALALHRTLVGEAGRFPRLGAAWYAAGPATSQAIFAAFLTRRLAARPGSAMPDVQLLARLFHDMVAGDLHHRALFEPEPAGEAERAAAVAAAVQAVRALAGPGR